MSRPAVTPGISSTRHLSVHLLLLLFLTLLPFVLASPSGELSSSSSEEEEDRTTILFEKSTLYYDRSAAEFYALALEFKWGQQGSFVCYLGREESVVPWVCLDFFFFLICMKQALLGCWFVEEEEEEDKMYVGIFRANSWCHQGECISAPGDGVTITALMVSPYPQVIGTRYANWILGAPVRLEGDLAISLSYSEDG